MHLGVVKYPYDRPEPVLTANNNHLAESPCFFSIVRRIVKNIHYLLTGEVAHGFYFSPDT